MKRRDAVGGGGRRGAGPRAGDGARPGAGEGRERAWTSSSSRTARSSVGVLPPLGGRVVLLKTAGGENLLDSDPRLWKPPFPPPSIDTPFRPWNGRIVWVGPQTGFWSQQDLKPDRKKARAGWPPDPFNETGRFEVRGAHGHAPEAEGRDEPGDRPRLRARVRDHGRAHGADEDDGHERAGDPGLVGPLAEHAREDRRLPLRQARPRADAPDGRPAARRRGRRRLPERGARRLAHAGARPQARLGRKKLWAKAYVRPSTGLIAYFLGRQHARHPRAPRAEAEAPRRAGLRRDLPGRGKGSRQRPRARDARPLRDARPGCRARASSRRSSSSTTRGPRRRRATSPGSGSWASRRSARAQKSESCFRAPETSSKSWPRSASTGSATARSCFST